MLMRENLYTIITDGSNYTGREKMNPLTVRVNRVAHRFLDMCTTSGTRSDNAAVSHFDLEDVVVDVGFWFKGSTNRKGFLAEFCELFESEYLEVLQHASVRWLSLETCVTHILRLYEPLASYFQSTEGNQPRLKRLQGRPFLTP
ncbi:4-hydroxy-tetrahydrodipicolinate synthase [Dissostichus eleginoides]|uniref:4-hydroxy-tetrahydrodipicolinate synthase n=1 Tax=Dissostichus eleginoides TaxID=100907 RepID=A0AAD9CQN1_DISEL|nr:4-hydroxy-tetrahydrodipicolinate synthase [Dissostichus eleginoides]